MKINLIPKSPTVFPLTLFTITLVIYIHNSPNRLTYGEFESGRQ